MRAVAPSSLSQLCIQRWIARFRVGDGLGKLGFARLCSLRNRRWERLQTSWHRCPSCWSYLGKCCSSVLFLLHKLMPTGLVVICCLLPRGWYLMVGRVKFEMYCDFLSICLPCPQLPTLRQPVSRGRDGLRYGRVARTSLYSIRYCRLSASVM